MKRKTKNFSAGGDYDSSEDARNLLAAAEREEREFKGMGSDVIDETGMKSRLKRNMETGELYDPEGTKSEKTEKRKSKSPPLRTAFQKRADKQQAARDALRAKREARSKEPLGQMSDVVAAKKGGKVSSASSRADGIAQRGKTRGRII
jgi:hypothetical protein